MIKKRDTRQEAIRSIIRSEPIKTQSELVERLKAEGYDCTQATVSRDITELNLEKISGGFYVLAEERRLQRFVVEFVLSVEAANNLCVIKTLPGNAGSVCAVLDSAHLNGMLGTIAGDDTILAILDTEEHASSLKELLITFQK